MIPRPIPNPRIATTKVPASMVTGEKPIRIGSRYLRPYFDEINTSSAYRVKLDQNIKLTMRFADGFVCIIAVPGKKSAILLLRKDPWTGGLTVTASCRLKWGSSRQKKAFICQNQGEHLGS